MIFRRVGNDQRVGGMETASHPLFHFTFKPTDANLSKPSCNRCKYHSPCWESATFHHDIHVNNYLTIEKFNQTKHWDLFSLVRGDYYLTVNMNNPFYFQKKLEMIEWSQLPISHGSPVSKWWRWVVMLLVVCLLPQSPYPRMFRRESRQAVRYPNQARRSIAHLFHDSLCEPWYQAATNPALKASL